MSFGKFLKECWKYGNRIGLYLFNDIKKFDYTGNRSNLEQIRAMTRARLTNGVTDAALLVTYESRFREPDQTCERWLAHQRGKITRTLAAFEPGLPDPLRAELVQITLAAALGYLDWRQPLEWRGAHPALEKWLDAFGRNHRL